METQTAAPSTPPTEATKERERRQRLTALNNIDTRPIDQRLRGMVGTTWDDVHRKLCGLKAFSRPDRRRALDQYLLKVVAPNEDALPDAPYHVGSWTKHNDQGVLIEVRHNALIARRKKKAAAPDAPATAAN